MGRDYREQVSTPWTRNVVIISHTFHKWLKLMGLKPELQLGTSMLPNQRDRKEASEVRLIRVGEGMGRNKMKWKRGREK